MKTNKELLKSASANLQQLNNVAFVMCMIAAVIVLVGGFVEGQPVYFLISAISAVLAYTGYLLVSVIARIGIEISSKD